MFELLCTVVYLTAYICTLLSSGFSAPAMRLTNGIGQVLDHSSWEICLSMRQISLRERVEIA